jgi:predicted esterase
MRVRGDARRVSSMRHLLLALPLLAACSSESFSLPDGGAYSGCYVPPDAGIFVNGLPSPIPGCSGVPGPTGTMDLATIGWSAQGGVLFVPPTAAPGTPLPAVFVFHGSGGTGQDARARFGLEGPADGGAIFVYPTAVQQNAWDIRPNSFDGRRLDLLLQKLTQSYCIDPNRIYLAGFSAGAVFTLYMGCNVPGPFHGMAVVAGTDDRFDTSCCTGTISGMFIHGTADDTIPIFEGQRARGDLLARDHCGSTPTPDDANCQRYNCPAPLAVDYCEWVGDHDIPPFAGEEITRFFGL